MFARIAGTYDVLNHTLSLGIDRRWRRRVVERAGDLDGRLVVDELQERAALTVTAEIGHGPQFDRGVPGARTKHGTSQASTGDGRVVRIIQAPQ